MPQLVKLSKEEVNSFGTSLKGYLYTTYNELVELLGEPTYLPEDSGDGKVNFEWVVEFNDEIFTIYDWKTYDPEYSMNELDQWNIGGKTYCGDFSDFIESKLKA